MIEDAERAIRMVKEAAVLAFDTETSGVDWKKNFPIGYVFCADPKGAIYVPIRAGGGGNLCPSVPVPKSATELISIHPFEKDLARAFKERKGITVGHNLKFDCHMAANAGITLGRNLSCTQNYQTLLDEYSYSYSLEDCADYHKVEAKKGKELYSHLASVFGGPDDRKSMARFWELPGNDPLAVEYAKGDGITSFQLWQTQRKRLADEGVWGIATELEDPLIWTLFRMERRGIAVDEKYLNQLGSLIDEKVNEAKRLLPKDFNVRAPTNLKPYLESINKKDWPVTEKGNPSFSEHWLKTFQEGRNIIVVRKWTTLANMFVKPLIEEHVKDGRVHATFNQLRADDAGTPARLSCSNPNLQQIPKRDKDIAHLFRKTFIADEGFEFNEADWSQCEPRLYAHYSQEPSLVEGYLKEPFEDVHSISSRLMGVDRQTAKTMNMGLLGCMLPKAFAVHMGWDINKAQDIWGKWHATYPRIKSFQEQAKAVLLRRGYVKTILGRKLRLEEPRFAYHAVSKIIQGGNADILKYCMLRIDKLLEAEGDEDAHLLASVHDSLEWQSKKNKRGRQLTEEIKKIMVDVQGPPFNLRVPFVVDHKAGNSWSDATFGEE